MMESLVQRRRLRPVSVCLKSHLIISFIIGPYYLDKNAATIIDQDAGYWILDTGLKRYSVDCINIKEQSDSFTLIDRWNFLDSKSDRCYLKMTNKGT